VTIATTHFKIIIIIIIIIKGHKKKKLYMLLATCVWMDVKKRVKKNLMKQILQGRL
jgi:hypothetical protein